MSEERYTTLGRDGEGEYDEKKSVFLGHAKRVCTEEEAQAFIKSQQKKFYDARHNVWAYLLKDGTARYSDDGEPQGSAGIPVLEILRKSGVTDAAVVVTRYFGGILLGTGGLMRAYSKAAKSALDDANIVTYVRYSVLSLTCSYAEYQRYLAELPKFDAVVDGTEFGADVTLTFAVRTELLESVTARIRELSNGTEIPEKIGERYGC